MNDAKQEAYKLLDQGLNIKEISIQIKRPYRTVYGWLRKNKVKSKAGHNADRHLCRTCRFRESAAERSKGFGCRYWDIMGCCRGCEVENCDVYEELSGIVGR